MTSPLEAVDTAGAHRTAEADALVVAAWADHHGVIYAFLVRTTRDPAVDGGPAKPDLGGVVEWQLAATPKVAVWLGPAGMETVPGAWVSAR